MSLSGLLITMTNGQQGIQTYNLQGYDALDNCDPQGDVLKPILETIYYKRGDVINIDFEFISKHQMISDF